MRVLFLAALLVAAVALSSVQAGVVFERTTVPKGWTMLGAAPANAPVSFTIGLVTRNDAQLEKLFWAVSEPDSLDYLQHLTSSEVEERFGAAEEDRVAVHLWLTKNGATGTKDVSNSIRVTTTAAAAARLFDTEMMSFRHDKTGQVVAKAWGAYSLPADIHPRVEIVTGISSFPVPGKSSPFKRPTSAAPSDEGVIPQTLTAMYNIRAQKPGSVTTATQGVVEYISEFFSNNDTAAYAQLVGYTTPSTMIRPILPSHVVGTNDPTSPGVESSLDVQMMAAVNLEVDMWFWIEDGSGWLYEFGTHILNATVKPQVTSTSYGWWEGDQCAIDGSECQELGVDSYGYTAAVNKLFQKIGVIGVSLIVASGDSGANGRTDEGCDSRDALRPEFPSSSPYVTSVGATEIRNATYFPAKTAPVCSQVECVNMGIEVAVSLDYSGFTSGGGFSNVSGATRPRYQNNAVHGYLTSGVMLPNATYFNRHGRGAPDVSAVGHAGVIVVSNSSMIVGGTSMSAPIFGGIISLLNTIAITKTGQPLGFLNPLLYKMAVDDPATFHDITVGDNICPEAGCSPTCQGFYAAPGWDPVTGLGTPNAAEMEAYVSKQMDKFVARRATRLAAA